MRPGLLPRIEYLFITSLPRRGHERFRGANAPVDLTHEDLATLRSWNANLVRFRLVPVLTPEHEPGTSAYAREFLLSVQDQVARLGAILPACQDLGLRVLIDLHAPPGRVHGKPETRKRLFEEAWVQMLFQQVWEQIVVQVVPYPAVWGYDLLHEPRGSTGKWRAVADATIERIRHIDPDRTIVVEPRGGAPRRLPELEPFDPDANVT
jgi:aryl-phospho-beta-D-glucosidase BglC (GH1 family)